jgi:hypothetical protein
MLVTFHVVIVMRCEPNLVPTWVFKLRSCYDLGLDFSLIVLKHKKSVCGVKGDLRC